MELQLIHSRIYTIRNHIVMLDFHLAEMYEVENRILKQLVRRNIDRFPEDFMFELTRNEVNLLIDNIRSQSVIFDWPSITYTPFTFTEQGVAMLSSVLKSPKAIAINISIMKAFVATRQHLADYKDLKEKLDSIEKEMNIKFDDVYQAINYLISPNGQRNKIEGYRINQ
jgi:hypothetical protein